MADNVERYGWRFFQSTNGRGEPRPIKGFVDTGESFDVAGGAANAVLRVGDLVRRKASGGFEQADGTEATPEAAYGVVASIVRYWDAAEQRMKFADGLPSDIAWGTNLERQTLITVIPVENAWWEVDCDAIAGTGLLSDYQTLIGLNADHVLTGVSADPGPFLKPKLDIGTAAVTNTLLWRIENVSPNQENNDFTGENVKMIVSPNIAQRPAFGGTTGL